LWDYIIDFKPQAWLWMGDVIYVNLPGMEVLKRGYNRQLKQPGERPKLGFGVIFHRVVVGGRWLWWLRDWVGGGDCGSDSTI